MMMARLLAFLALAGLVVCDREHFDGDKVFRITPKNAEQVDLLLEMQATPGIDFWTDVISANVSTDVHVPKVALIVLEQKFKALGLDYSVVIDDLEKEVAGEEEEVKTNTFANGFNYYTYNRLAAIQEEVKRLQAKHSSVSHLFTVGRSYEGRDMLAIRISASANQLKPAIWIDGCIHAREWISCASVMFFLKQMLEPEPAHVERVAEVLSKYDVYILPVFNVDGYEYTHTNNRMWRKTRSKGRYCRGADPNRNWDSHFGGVGTSDNECTDIYHGKRAFSEREVRQVANKLMSLKGSIGLKAYWNIHAYSQLVLYPWSYTRDRAPDHDEIDRVAHVYADGIRASSGKIFRCEQPSRILYSVAGGSIDWTYEKLGVVYSYVSEMRPRPGELLNGFLLPAKYIRPSGMEFTNGMLNAIVAMK